MKLRSQLAKRWGVLIGGLLLLGSLITTELATRASHRPTRWVVSTNRSGETGKQIPSTGERPADVLKQELIPGEAKDARGKVFRLIELHKREPWFAARMFGTPFSDRRDLWAFFAEIKKELGAEAVPTLVELTKSAKSDFYKQMYLAMLVGIKDPASEPALVHLLEDDGTSTMSKRLAIYGLGLLNTDTAWATVRKLWKTIEEYPGLGPIGAYAALEAFGVRSTDFLLKGSWGPRGQGDAPPQAGLISHLRGVDPQLLAKLIRDSKSSEVRESAIYTLTQGVDAQRISLMTDLMISGENTETKNWAVAYFIQEFRSSRFSLNEYPEALSRIVSSYSTLPLNLQLALQADPGIRSKLPISLDQLAKDPQSMPVPAFRSYMCALASDPALHPRLAELLTSTVSKNYDLLHWGPMDIAGTLENSGQVISDPALGMAVAQLAIDPTQKFENTKMWDLLSCAPIEAQSKVVNEVPGVYFGQSNEFARMLIVSQVGKLGPVAAPTLVQLLGEESSPLVRLELANSILASPDNQGNSTLMAELKPMISDDIAPILDGRSQAGVQYALLHPWGGQVGVQRFAGLLRDYIAVYGRLDQESDFKNIPNRVYVPENLNNNDLGTAEAIRQSLNEAVLQGIDEMKIRDGR